MPNGLFSSHETHCPEKHFLSILKSRLETNMLPKREHRQKSPTVIHITPSEAPTNRLNPKVVRPLWHRLRLVFVIFVDFILANRQLLDLLPRWHVYLPRLLSPL